MCSANFVSNKSNTNLPDVSEYSLIGKGGNIIDKNGILNCEEKYERGAIGLCKRCSFPFMEEGQGEPIFTLLISIFCIGSCHSIFLHDPLRFGLDLSVLECLDSAKRPQWPQ